VEKENIGRKLTLCAENNDLLILDFDHTLLSGNSTELFISNARPKALVSFIDVVVRGFIPWRMLRTLHPHRLRDWACIVLISMISPWNILLWRLRAPLLFRALENRTISDAVSAESKQNSVILTFGTRFVIKAMLKDSDWAKSLLIANPFLSRLNYFSMGKLDLAKNHLSNPRLRSATFITDSEDDKDLLDYSRNGILINPQGNINNTEYTSYFPLRYTANVKYPRRYVFDQLVFVDILLLILSCNFNAVAWYVPLIIVPLLFTAVMCIYELGYYENDMMAAVNEVKPTLGDRVDMYRQYPIAEGWLWAATLSIVGLTITAALQDWDAARFGIVAVGWATALIVIRAIFRLYNQIGADHRINFYMLLQLCKYTPLAIVLPISVLGAVILASQAVTMWIHYIVYRSGGKPLYTSKDVVRPIVSATALGFLLISSPDVDLFGVTTLLYLIWSAIRLRVGSWVTR
jgi:hypothetical protein